MSAATMVNNFKPNDLKEIIAVYLPAAFWPTSLIAPCAPQESAKSNPDRTAPAFRAIRRFWSPRTNGGNVDHALLLAASDSVCI